MAVQNVSVSAVLSDGRDVVGNYTVDYDALRVDSAQFSVGGSPLFIDLLSFSSISQNGSTYTYNETTSPIRGATWSLTLTYTGKTPTTLNSGTFVSINRPVVGDTTREEFSVVSSSVTVDCFVTGTQIRTVRGNVAVEDLQVGDQAVTASGGLRPVIWIGQRELVEPTYEQAPVRIRAGAFGHGLPVRDLYLSPGHPVLVGADANNEGGVLVPIMCLENGTSIRREPRSSITYWHVELDTHDILLAEGLPTESYIDGGDRAFFLEAFDHALHNPDFLVPGWDGRCRPVAIDGAIVDAERLRLDAVFAASMAAQSAWPAAELNL